MEGVTESGPFWMMFRDQLWVMIVYESLCDTCGSSGSRLILAKRCAGCDWNSVLFGSEGTHLEYKCYGCGSVQVYHLPYPYSTFRPTFAASRSHLEHITKSKDPNQWALTPADCVLYGISVGDPPRDA